MATSTTRQTAEDYIGVDELYIAPLTTDDEKGATWGTPHKFAPVAELSKSTSSDTAKSYYDNSAYRVIASEDSDEIKLTVPALDLETLAEILGKTIDTDTKAFIDSGEPETKYFALYARGQLSDNTYRYFVWHKVSFAVPDDTLNTKEDKITTNGQELTATAIRTQAKFSVGASNTGIKRIIADARDGKVDFAKWYTAVPVPGSIPTVSE